MSDISLKLEERTVEGKRVAKLRRAGIVPSVVYGNVPEPLPTQSEFVATTKIVQAAGRHTPVNLTIGGKKKLAIIKSIDFDPVKRSVRHVAFHAIKQNEKIITEAPVVLVGEGESPAEKAGLVVLQAIESLEVKALPANLPEALEISIAELESTDDKLTVADIRLPEGVEFADPEQDTSLVVANVYEPSALQAANEAAGGQAEGVEDVEAENGEEAESTAPATGASDEK